MEAISENAKGQLKGGFAVFSGYGGPGGLEKPDDNKSCTNNNCTNHKCGGHNTTSCSNNCSNTNRVYDSKDLSLD